jgi:hypothetical protein
MRNPAIMAETGNFDLDLLAHKERVAHKERLLMIHRALNNPLDTKTAALMQAATEACGSSAIQSIQITLKKIGVNLLPDTFLAIPYQDIKHILKQALHNNAAYVTALTMQSLLGHRRSHRITAYHIR